jgi:hypothetical protein
VERKYSRAVAGMSFGNESSEIKVEQVERKSADFPGEWLFTWRVQNNTADPMRLLSIRVPHEKFRATEKTFERPLEISVGTSVTFDMTVFCNQPQESIVENAFLILLIDWRQAHWRLFVRLQIRVNKQAMPDTVIASITVQRVGFSGIS